MNETKDIHAIIEFIFLLQETIVAAWYEQVSNINFDENYFSTREKFYNPLCNIFRIVNVKSLND